MPLLEFLELEQVLGAQFREFPALLFQNFEEFIDLELAQIRNRLDDPPLLIPHEGNAAAKELEESLFIEFRLRVSGNNNEFRCECGGGTAEPVIPDNAEHADILIIVSHLLRRDCPRRG